MLSTNPDKDHNQAFKINTPGSGQIKYVFTCMSPELNLDLYCRVCVCVCVCACVVGIYCLNHNVRQYCIVRARLFKHSNCHRNIFINFVVTIHGSE